ncbi:MAG: YlbF family regulator [Clostridia bacterium]|nr:YlbF family regulator [Clostridia bacterium]
MQEATKKLCEALQQTAEYRDYRQYKTEIDQDSAIQALVKEYKRLQMTVQMRMLSGQGMDDDDGRRFQQLSALLFADPRTSGYLLAEMRLQQMMAGIFEQITRAAGMDMPVPV